MIKSLSKYFVIIFATLPILMIGFQNCSQSRINYVSPEASKTSEELAAQTSRIDDLNTLMLGMFETEKQNRLNSESAINLKIDGVSADLAQFKHNTNIAITTLQLQTVNLQTQLNSQQSDYNLQIAKVQSNIDKLGSELNGKLFLLDISLREALNLQIGDLTNKLNAQKKDILDQLKLASDDNSQKLTDVRNSLIKNENDIIALAKANEEFKVLVATTYATKESLKSLQILFDGLSQVTHNLNLKIDITKEQILTQLDDRLEILNDKVNRIKSKVDKQGKDINQLKSDMIDAIKDYRTEISEMSYKLNEKMQENQKKMYQFIRKENENLRDDFFDQMKKQSLELTIYTRKAVGAIAARVEDLQKQLDDSTGLTKDQIDQLKDCLEETKKQMTEALTEEQVAREQLAVDLKNLSEKVKLIQKDLTLTQVLVAQNTLQLQRLTINFEQEKNKIADRFQAERQLTDQKMLQLSQDFQTKLQKVSDQAEDMVKGLGEDVKKNFKSVVTDIAILNSRQATVENNLKSFVEEYQTNKAKTLNLEINLQKPKKDATDALISSMRSLSQVQLDFIRIIDPDEDKKDYYNDSFLPIAKKCGGRVDTSFPNALGLDSFQILAMEYTRLLLLGERRGEQLVDQIFHHYAEASSIDNFHRLMMLALIRYPVGSENPTCLNDIQNWARGVLLVDPQFQMRRKFLANDDGIDRSIEGLYSALIALEGPARDIENLLSGSLQGTLQFQSAFNVVKNNTALELINNAQSSLYLADRVQTLSHISEFYEQNYEDDADAAKKISQLKSDLDAFKTTTNQRLSALETQQGQLQTAVKRALDVIISLSDRAGYSDLKAYTVWAGSSINYVPQMIPGFSPKIQQVQHFFSGPLSLRNKSDACTGAKILANGGIQDYYQYGSWGACWVNFRNFPHSAWNNETKSLWFRVFGAANTINIKVEPGLQKLTNVHEYTNRTTTQWAALWAGYNYNRTFDFRNLSPNDPVMKLTGTFSAGVFDIKAADALNYYIQYIRQWSGVKLTFTPLKRDQFGDQTSEMVGPPSYYVIQLFSPLIIDMKKRGVPKTISSADSQILFDLMATGKPQRVGWVGGDEAGILALDNEDGSIKNGSQLFGEATIIKETGLKAKNGFEALAQHDDNLDGAIDAKDAIFARLKVWQDKKMDGRVDAGELKSLAELGIKLINLKYKEVDSKLRQNNGNDLRYFSESDVKVYDVFFGMSINQK